MRYLYRTMGTHGYSKTFNGGIGIERSIVAEAGAEKEDGEEMNTGTQVEIVDADIRKALDGYEYSFLADTLRVVFENGVEVEGELWSITPVYLLKDSDGMMHTIRTDKLIDTQRIRTATVDERLFAAKRQREQVRKAALLGAVCEGGAILVSERPEEGGECQ